MTSRALAHFGGRAGKFAQNQAVVPFGLNRPVFPCPLSKFVGHIHAEKEVVSGSVVVSVAIPTSDPSHLLRSDWKMHIYGVRIQRRNTRVRLSHYRMTAGGLGVERGTRALEWMQAS